MQKRLPTVAAFVLGENHGFAAYRLTSLARSDCPRNDSIGDGKIIAIDKGFSKAGEHVLDFRGSYLLRSDRGSWAFS